jgi:hypothetical protein
MIVFDLRCRDGGEVFEGWFSSSADFDDQIARGLLHCPYCQSSEVEKAPMAPHVGRRTNQLERTGPLRRLAELQGRMLEGSQWVGAGFPEEARAMHLGEIEHRPVHGEASSDEVRSLIEDGVPVLPLPLPVVPPEQVN